jgi:ParB family chromosome partitioning protein
MKNIDADPFCCRMWDLHDRIDTHISETTCKQMIESIAMHGQLVPALGRLLANNLNFDIELIYGARRLFIARHLNRPLRVELRDISDTEAIVAMDIENRHRLDISPYERGLSYLRWLRGNHFRSQDDIARALQVSPSQISRLLKLAHLPAVVVGAFACPANICEYWGVELFTILEDPARRSVVCARARSIASMQTRLPARQVYAQLLSAGVPGRRLKMRRHDEVVMGHDGKPLFRIAQRASSVALLLPMSAVSEGGLERVRAAVKSALQSENHALTGTEPSTVRHRAATQPQACVVEP